MIPHRATIGGLQQWPLVSILLLLAACSTMSEQERKAFLCEEWERGTKKIDQLKATYIFATGKQLRVRSGGPRTGVHYVEGDLKQLAQEVDAACRAQNLE